MRTVEERHFNKAKATCKIADSFVREMYQMSEGMRLHRAEPDYSEDRPYHDEMIRQCDERYQELCAHVAGFPLFACRYAMEALLSGARIDPLQERWEAKWEAWIPF